MRAFKLISTILLVAIALTAGLVAATVVAVIALVVFLAGRILGPAKIRVTGPRFQRHSQPSRSTPAQDAIDVTATEVASEPARALGAASEEDERLRA